MFGGTAQTYCRWKLEGEPFKEGKAYYVMAVNPATKIAKKIRWYTDKAHADLMPNKAPKQFPGKIFGFENSGDYILAIRERDITEAEEDAHFKANWTKNGVEKCWRFGMFFGGIWYAPKDAAVPPIGKTDRVMRVSWPDFVKAAQARSEEKKGFWFSEEVTAA